MSIVKVNRSGATHKIYETTAATKQIGTLYNNEMLHGLNSGLGVVHLGIICRKLHSEAAMGQ